MLKLTPQAAFSPVAAFSRLVSTQSRLFSRAHSGAKRTVESRAAAPGPARSPWESREDTGRLLTPQSFYVTCHPGLEEVVAAELTSQNIRAQEVVPGKAGVFFRGPDAVGYRANLWLRSGIRVLRLLAKGHLSPYRAGGDEIYSFFRQAANWARLLPPKQTFQISARVTSCTDISSSQLVQIRGRDAICDSIRDARGSKPEPPEKGQVANLPLYVALFRDECSLYMDMSGDSLHKRGYRTAMHTSSLNEAAAAGVLSLASWPEALSQGHAGILADPMCGSGTFLIEAALMATNTAPGLYRQRWPFQSWPDFDRSAWDSSVASARQAQRTWDGMLLGNDVHQGALRLAKSDARSAEVSHLIKWHSGPCSQWVPRDTPSTVVVNPPWGLRLLNDAENAESDQDTRADIFNGVRRARRGGSGGYQQAEKKLYEGTSLQAAWVDLRSFLKVDCHAVNCTRIRYTLLAAFHKVN
ncbi:hypothetical protein ABBQ32_012319 [Trebouxia sp. C0010 RCD-2024]